MSPASTAEAASVSLTMEVVMLYWAIVFAIISAITGLLGFRGISGAASTIAKLLFAIFLILFLFFLLAGIGVIHMMS